MLLFLFAIFVFVVVWTVWDPLALPPFPVKKQEDEETADEQTEEQLLLRSVVANEATIEKLQSQLEYSKRRTEDLERTILETGNRGERQLIRLRAIRGAQLYPWSDDIVRNAEAYIARLEAEIQKLEQDKPSPYVLLG